MKVGTDAMLLGSLIKSDGKERMLDVGAGTGVISLMVAQNNPSLIIHAVELDGLSADECQHNFKNSPWNNRLTVIQSNFLRYESDHVYDLIISNPPYFQTRLKNDEYRKAQARHEDALPVKAFFEKVGKFLDEEGMCWIIVPTEDEESWLIGAEGVNLFPEERIRIVGKRGGKSIRTIFGFTTLKKEVNIRELVIRESDGLYSEEYVDLTKEFHGKAIKRR
ncbi:MAG: methyltransferase [Crocinitomicaceae bacterium]|nr:methyltransferase [Crocinitomicaceae bacterium]